MWVSRAGQNVVLGIRYTALDLLKISEKLTDIAGFLNCLEFCVFVP